MKYFGTDGIRGKYGEKITCELAYKLGYSLKVLGEEYVVLGRDTRESGSKLLDAVAAGAFSAGLKVVDCGVVPTPALLYYSKIKKCAGVMITASHNPYYDNGLKVVNQGDKISFEIEEVIENTIDTTEYKVVNKNSEELKKIEPNDFFDEYYKKLNQFVVESDLRIAIDSANGASYKTAKFLFSKVTDSLFVMGDKPDGVNINNNVGSTHPEQLQKFVLDNNCDLGFAFDGDADRLLAVDSNGKLITGDELIYLYAKYLHNNGNLNQNTVVFTVMSNLGIISDLKKEGINSILTAVGDKNVIEALTSNKLSVGGENSGHIILPDMLHTGDGVMNALFLTKILTETKTSLKDSLKSIKLFPELLVNVKVRDKAAVLKDNFLLETEKKIKEEMGCLGKVILRSSGTEDLIRVLVSCKDEKKTLEYSNKLVKIVEETSTLAAIVLAAGKGTRMKTDLPKCAFPLLEKPMISYIIETLQENNFDNIITVLGHKKEVFFDLLGNSSKYAIQKDQLGTGDAVKSALSLLSEYGTSLIIPGDTPLIDTEIISGLIKLHESNNNDFTIGTIILDNPTGYGRIKRNNNGDIINIIEEKEANELERKITEVNTGIYLLKNRYLKEAVNNLKNENSKKEYYLTDIVNILSTKVKIGSYSIKDVYKLTGINDLYTLSEVENKLRYNINKKHMLNGVNIVNSNSVTIGPDVLIEPGVKVLEGSLIYGKTKIKKNAVIGPYSKIRNSVIEENSKVIHSTVSDSVIGKNATFGPYSHIRQHGVVGPNNRVGNFVEIKKSTLGDTTKVAHLTYIGDATVGDRVNFGCGTVISNYDGKKKYQTIVGNDVFIGCNTNLIAPVIVEDETFIAAGSTITDRVYKHDFAIARVKQTNKKGYAKKYFKK